jgi:hypothetical protein
VQCDEAGGGTADLPPEAVLVLLPRGVHDPVSHIPGPLDVIGTFEVGNRTDVEGRTSNFRLRLEAPLQSTNSQG